MSIEDLIELVRKYPEFEDDLDETACLTGFVYCPICDGGGYVGTGRRNTIPTHQPDCIRAIFEKEHPCFSTKKDC